MADAAVTFLVQKLRLVMVDCASLFAGLEGELKKLQCQLQLLLAFLEDPANKWEMEELRKIEREIREAVYEAEDAIDAYLTHAAAPSKSGCFLPFNQIPLRLKQRKTVKALKEQRLSSLLDVARKALADASATTAQHQKDAQLPLVRQHEVVGFEDVAAALINHLLEESEALDTISIVGMGGLGKTTLAKKIYGDHRIQSKFQNLIWIAAQDFNIKNVWLSILNNFTQEDMSELTSSLLADIVRKNLQNRRFLIVLDDVWDTKDWTFFNFGLPRRNNYGKVLITTRNWQVAREVNHKRDPHCLRSLTCQESWELLQLQVFGKLGKCPSKLEDVGKQIATGCGGLPLAIVVIGGILRGKLSTSHHEIDEWKKVSSSLNTYLGHDKGDSLERIIGPSYDKLPNELRSCFLYMGVYPKDTVIPAWELTRLWIAEGFITPQLGKSPEKAADDYLEELIDRNLVKLHKTKAGGGIKTCRLSSMTHEFCKTQASFAEQNLFQEVKRSRYGVFRPPISEVKKCHRICIHSHVEDFIRQKPKGPHVRSFLCFSNEDITLQNECVSEVIEAFKCLRVLDVKPIKLSRIPSKIANLTHLRYISLSCDNLNAFPEAVCKLWNLQTIRIDTMSRTLEIKANIWKNISLRHLKTKAAIVISREAKGKAGENLQSLSRLSAQSFSEDMCKWLPNLKSLGIRGHLGTLLKTNYMERLNRLQKLKLVHDVYPTLSSEDPLNCLPRPEAFPPSLTILELSSTFLKWKHMRTLGSLPTLEILKLKANAFMGRLWEVDDGLFPSLEVLLIKDTDLVVWSATEDSFPRLRCLVLKKCQKLHEIPRALAKSLHELDIEHVPNSAVESAKEIEMEKLQMEDQPGAKRGDFKLNIGPGDYI